MPELPEVETIARGLQPLLPGRRIGSVEVLHADVLREPPDDFERALRGRLFIGVGRHGKNLALELDPPGTLWVNLGMTGRLLAVLPDRPAPSSPPTHPALRFELEGGGTLVYDDVRRFGSVEHLAPPETEARIGRLGPEPLAPDFGPDALAAKLSRSRSPVRSWLLDQRKVSGVGNIYANEALHRAGIHPARPARSVRPAEAAELHRELRDVLEEAVESRGTTLRDYRDATGERGRFGSLLRVYGREGEPCTACGSPIRRIVFGSRSAFLCPRCQPGPDTG